MHRLYRITIWLLMPVILLCALPALAADMHHKFVDVDGTKLHYVEAGTGQPLVLLHGNDGTLEDFTDSIFGTLSGQYRAICFDRPGHGLSESPKGARLTPEDQASMLHQALQQMSVRKPLIVAHSWSASLALSYALQYPNDLSGIVLIGGTAFATKEGKPKLSYYAAQFPVVGPVIAMVFKLTSRALIRRQVEEAFAPDLAPEPYVKRFLASLFTLPQLRAAARDEIVLNPSLRRMSKQYDQISTPVVIVVGDHDQTVSPHKHSYALHRSIKHSKLIVIKDGGHELHFTRPQEILKAIKVAEQDATTQLASPTPAAL